MRKKLLLSVSVCAIFCVCPIGISAQTITDADWSGLGSGMNSNVNAIAIDGSGNLFAGGAFTLAGGVSANYIAKWNASTGVWSNLGSGTTYDVNVLVVDKAGNLYAGGGFYTAGGVLANCIAKWDGSTWSSLDSGMKHGPQSSTVWAIVIDSSGNLYAGGYFDTAGGVYANGIAKWNGSTWSSLGSGMYVVLALAFDKTGNLYAGGDFTSAGGVSANYIAKWNSSTGVWSNLGSGVNQIVYALAFDQAGNLYAGGSFDTAGGVYANGIAKWNGSTWSSLGSGLDDWTSMSNSSPQVNSLTFDSSGNLYVGGYFAAAGGVSANNIARWDINKGAWNNLGSGTGGIGPLNNQVTSLAIDASRNLYAGGYFDTMGRKVLTNIAKCIVNMPEPPTLSSPSNNAENQPFVLTVCWNGVQGALSYDLQVSMDSTFASTVLYQSAITSTSQGISGLVNSSTYYWRVNTANATNMSEWSSIWKFNTVYGTLDAPTLTSPPNNDSDQPIPLNLSWKNVANRISYSLQVATVSDFSVTIFSWDNSTVSSQTLAGLSAATTYYWRVYVSNPISTSNWSSTWSFMTTRDAPEVPILTSPSNNAILNKQQLTFPLSLNLNWSSITSAAFYTMQLSTASSFSSFSQATVLIDTAYVNSPQVNTNYYWRVSATNELGTSIWSSIWHFTIFVPVSILSFETAVKEPSFQINGSNLNYTIAQSGVVQISLCDMHGRKKIVFDGMQDAGSHILSLQSCNLATGVYLVYFKAGTIEKRKTIVLTKK